MSSKIHQISNTPQDQETQHSKANSWKVQRNGASAGEVTLTKNGKFRLTDLSGRRIGTFDTLAQIRHELETNPPKKSRERIRTSKALMLSGLVSLIISAGFAILGFVTLWH